MKVQNEMSTRISVDAVSAIGSMSAFRNAIRGASDAWRAQEVALRNSGNFAGAAQERMRGLNQVIDLQKAKLEELQDRQEGLDLSNQKQANQFLKLERPTNSWPVMKLKLIGHVTRFVTKYLDWRPYSIAMNNHGNLLLLMLLVCRLRAGRQAQRLKDTGNCGQA